MSNSVTMLDPFWIKQFQLKHQFCFSFQQLEEARHNEGELMITVDGYVRFLTIPTLRFPDDLLTTDIEQKIERGIFDE